MLAHRLLSWANIKSTLVQCIVFTGMWPVVLQLYSCERADGIYIRQQCAARNILTNQLTLGFSFDWIINTRSDFGSLVGGKQEDNTLSEV